MRRVLLCLLLTGCLTGEIQIPEETGSVEAFFCGPNQTNCAEVFANKTAIATQIDCAIYHSSGTFNDILNKKNARLVTDEEYPLSGSVVEFGSGLMHNKFCIIDNEFVWTGSWNPNQDMKIPNNIVLIQSKTLAKAYQLEFNELFGKIFHKGEPNPGLVKLNGQLFEAYFCPEDNCQENVLRVLENARNSIHFMTYSFTDDKIGDLLLRKNQQGLDVKGVFRSTSDQGGEYTKLKYLSKKANIHHKVFIIDGNTVITGSYNPSRNANERNDENVIIIRDAAVAQLFEDEFSRFFVSSS